MSTGNPDESIDPLSSTVGEKEDSESDEALFDDDDDVDTEKKEEVLEQTAVEKSFDDDLFITVTDPAKQVHTMETFVTYKVTTNTTRATFDSSKYIVQRRYHDFAWLQEKLEEEYPTFILAPLPSKFVVKGMLDRFSVEFMETRCHALNNFLQRLSKHPVVSFSEHLKTFLTSDNFTPTGKQGLLAKMSGSLKWSNASNPEYEPISESAALFGEKMGVVDRINERILTEKRELVNELKEFAPTFTEWGVFEHEPMESVMASITESIEQCAEEMEKSITINEKELLAPLKEYILFAENIKQVLKRRDDFESQFEKVNEELKLRKEEKENLLRSEPSRSIGSFMSKTPEQKEERLVQQIKELSARREKLNDDLTRANTNFQVDYQRWKEQKLKDNTEMLSAFASTQIEYHDNCLKAWEKILPTLQKSAAQKKVED